MDNLDLTVAELEWVWLTLNKFPMLFLSQVTCLNCWIPQKNRHRMMRNCSLDIFFTFKVNNFFAVWKYEQFCVQFLKEEKLCLHCSHRSFVAHYPKKEQLIISIFSFGITLTLLPKVDRKEIQYSIERNETQNSQIAVIITKIDWFPI